MKDDNHYEPAFDAFLREQGCAVVPVVEARRSYLEARAVKSPDFLAVAPGGAKLVVDVKGRKFPGSGPGGKPRNVWHSWCEREDAESLVKWAASFGDHLLVRLDHDEADDDVRHLTVSATGRSWAMRWERVEAATAAYLEHGGDGVGSC